MVQTGIHMNPYESNVEHIEYAKQGEMHAWGNDRQLDVEHCLGDSRLM